MRLFVRARKRRKSVISDINSEESDDGDNTLPFMSRVRQSGRAREIWLVRWRTHFNFTNGKLSTHVRKLICFFFFSVPDKFLDGALLILSDKKTGESLSNFDPKY